MRRHVLLMVATALASVPVATALAGDGLDEPAPRFALVAARVEGDRSEQTFELRAASVEIPGGTAAYALSAVQIGNGSAACGPPPELVLYSSFEGDE